jgi:hypothetical protein
MSGASGTGDSSGGGAPSLGLGGALIDPGPSGGYGANADAPRDPVTCDEALKQRSYVGCDYWPTVVANSVWSIFDFSVVIANGQSTAAEVTVTGPNGVNQHASVGPGSLTKLYLPWVKELKGPDADLCTCTNCDGAIPFSKSVKSPKSAYHLVSSLPVTVYQFNALEYGPAGGPPGKDWSSCPGNQFCEAISGRAGCFSFSNDAALLLPKSAMTGNYRVTGMHGQSGDDVISGHYGINGSFVSITAVEDGTAVKVHVSPHGQVEAGGPIPAAGPNTVVEISLDQGDVAELSSPVGDQYDLSGSLVQADKPVQVIAGMPGTKLPQDQQASDHLEETVVPAETLGKHYFVTVPSGPNGEALGHIVRLYGNADGTHLTYAPTQPAGCPSALNAGDTAECTGIVASDFEVTGDHEFAVGTFMLASAIVDPNAPYLKTRGDPSQSVAVAVEQYRLNYVFLAPDDYDVSYVDVIGPIDAGVTLDGENLGVPFTPISAGFGVARVKLGAGNSGAHLLSARAPVGIEVMGYGIATSYYYPGGLNLGLIAPPPVVK